MGASLRWLHQSHGGITPMPLKARLFGLDPAHPWSLPRGGALVNVLTYSPLSQPRPLRQALARRKVERAVLVIRRRSRAQGCQRPVRSPRSTGTCQVHRKRAGRAGGRRQLGLRRGTRRCSNRSRMVWIRVCVCVCVCVHVCARVHVCVCARTLIRMPAHVDSCMHACMHVACMMLPCM